MKKVCTAALYLAILSIAFLLFVILRSIWAFEVDLIGLKLYLTGAIAFAIFAGLHVVIKFNL